VFHDALRDRVCNCVDLGEDIIEGRNVIVPSFVKSCFNLFLCQCQVLAEKVNMSSLVQLGFVWLRNPAISSAFTVHLLSWDSKFFWSPAFANSMRSTPRRTCFPQELCEFSARSLTIVWDEGVADVIRVFKSLFLPPPYRRHCPVPRQRIGGSRSRGLPRAAHIRLQEECRLIHDASRTHGSIFLIYRLANISLSTALVARTMFLD